MTYPISHYRYTQPWHPKLLLLPAPWIEKLDWWTKRRLIAVPLVPLFVILVGGSVVFEKIADGLQYVADWLSDALPAS